LALKIRGDKMINLIINEEELEAIKHALVEQRDYIKAKIGRRPGLRYGTLTWEQLESLIERLGKIKTTREGGPIVAKIYN